MEEPIYSISNPNVNRIRFVNLWKKHVMAMMNLGFERLILPHLVERNMKYTSNTVLKKRSFWIDCIILPDRRANIVRRKLEQIQQIVPDFTDVRRVYRIYFDSKKLGMWANDLIKVLVRGWRSRNTKPQAIIDKVFPEFKSLTPVPSQNNLRSHTTTLWFPVLADLIKKNRCPCNILSVVRNTGGNKNKIQRTCMFLTHSPLPWQRKRFHLKIQAPLAVPANCPSHWFATRLRLCPEDHRCSYR